MKILINILIYAYNKTSVCYPNNNASHCFYSFVVSTAVESEKNLSFVVKMADGKEAEGGEDSIERNIDNLMPTFENLDPNYQDILDQCDSLRRSNLQLREEILRLERENAELKRQTLREKLNG